MEVEGLAAVEQLHAAVEMGAHKDRVFGLGKGFVVFEDLVHPIKKNLVVNLTCKFLCNLIMDLQKILEVIPGWFWYDLQAALLNQIDRFVGLRSQSRSEFDHGLFKGIHEHLHQLQPLLVLLVETDERIESVDVIPL